MKTVKENKGESFIIVNVPKNQAMLEKFIAYLSLTKEVQKFYAETTRMFPMHPWRHSEFANREYKSLVIYVHKGGELGYDFDYVMDNKEYWDGMLDEHNHVIDWEEIVNENA